MVVKSTTLEDYSLHGIRRLIREIDVLLHVVCATSRRYLTQYIHDITSNYVS